MCALLRRHRESGLQGPEQSTLVGIQYFNLSQLIAIRAVVGKVTVIKLLRYVTSYFFK